MHPRGLTGRLASLSSRHPWRIVTLWVAIFLIGGMVAGMFPAEMTAEALFTNEPESEHAEELILDRMEGSPVPDETVVIDSPNLTVDDPAYQTFVNELVTDIRGLPDNYIAQVASYYDTGEEWMISDDRQAMILPVFINNIDAGPADYAEVIEEADASGDFTVATGGEESVTLAFEESSESDLMTGEAIGISVALLVLVIVFGTLLSAGIPLGLAVTAITIAVGITMAIGHIFEMSLFVTNMIVMIGLAVGIDYALFIVGRYREERKHGRSSHDAVVRAGDTASKAVFFSGATVVIALLGMLLVPSNIFKSLGAGAITVVIVAVAATLTLLPAVLELLGDGIERGRGRVLTGVLGVALLLFASLFYFGLDVNPFFPIAYTLLGLASLVATVLNIDVLHLHGNGEEGGFWDRITGFVMKYPVAIVSVTTVSLIAIALVYFTISLGQSGVSSLPPDTSPHTAFELLESRFSGISLEDPHTVVIDANDVNSPEVQASIEELTALTGTDSEFGPPTVRVNEAGDLAVVSMPATTDTQSTEALDSVKRLRNDFVPQAFSDTNAEVYVGGPSAQTLDFNEVVDTYTPIVFVFVLGMSLVLLTLAFRSIVLPIMSVIMNLLSVGASYGLLVAVFQHGIGNDLLGFHQVERIDAWIPLMMFTILFGLSMDYHVFLLSRIKERYDLTRDNADAVAYGLRNTAAIITGAALIMVAVFGGFAMADLTMFQQMGFGLATAVILDATIVRVFLVPAGMKLLNHWNWYFPNWLGWLPQINVEGVPEELEPATAPAPAD